MAGTERTNGAEYGGDDFPGRESVQPDLRPRPDKLEYDVAAASRAVFTLHAKAPPDAFTAQHLGVKREGNAVLIDQDGLCLTIGYLITEATTVSLVDHAGAVALRRVRCDIRVPP